MEIKLRKPKISDLKEFQEVFNDKDVVNQLSGYNYPFSLEKAEKILSNIIKKNKKGNYYEFAIIFDRKYVGMIVLENPSKNKKTYTLGYALGKKYWNKGITSMAIKKILSFGFNELNLRKIKADNDESNPASARVLKKNGFKLIKKSAKKRGNVLYWGITDNSYFDKK